MSPPPLLSVSGLGRGPAEAPSGAKLSYLATSRTTGGLGPSPGVARPGAGGTLRRSAPQRITYWKAPAWPGARYVPFGPRMGKYRGADKQFPRGGPSPRPQARTFTHAPLGTDGSCLGKQETAVARCPSRPARATSRQPLPGTPSLWYKEVGSQEKENIHASCHVGANPGND